MLRPLWLLNIFLIVVALGLAAALVRSIVSPPAFVEVAQTANPVVGAPSPTPEDGNDVAQQLTARRRPLSEFDAILRGNLFNDPDQETKQKQKVRPAPPIPLPLLQGTIFIGNEAKAILKQGNREDLYDVGDRVAGGTLKKVEVDRVVIDFGDRQAEVTLKSAVKNLPPPPPEIRLDGSGASKPAAGSVSKTRTPREGSVEPVQSEPTIRSLRMRRAQEIFERQRQMREAQK